MLPAGDFFKHQEANLVAAVQKVGGLRVVRGAYQVALESVLHYVSVFFLCALAHGVAHIGEALVAVQAANLERLAVEEKALGRKARGAETKAGAELVGARAACQCGARQIQLRRVQLPQCQAGEVVELGFKTFTRHGHGLLVSHLAVYRAQLYQCAAGEGGLGGVGKETFDPHALGVGQFIRSFDLEVGNGHGVVHLQPHIAVNAGVGQVVDLAAEGRDLGVLATVHFHGDEVVAFLE